MLATVVLVATPAEAVRTSWRGVITFDKNQQHQFDSRVVWRLLKRTGNGPWKLVEKKAWRAGGGLPGRGGQDSCAKNRGWLPNGTYHLQLHRDYHGNLIKGRAFRLDDKRCPSGTQRNQLFLHTEQGAGSRQCRNQPGDQACRWEWPRINDYKSYGCIKMAPGDLRELVNVYHQHFGGGVRYSKAQVVLRVIN